MLSLACRRPWPWNSLCRTQSCRCLANTLQVWCVPSYSHALLSMDGRHTTLHTYTCMYIGKLAVMSCCPTVLCSYTELVSLGCTTANVAQRILHCILCLPAAPAAWRSRCSVGCVALTPPALQQPGCMSARSTWRCAPAVAVVAVSSPAAPAHDHARLERAGGIAHCDMAKTRAN